MITINIKKKYLDDFDTHYHDDGTLTIKNLDNKSDVRHYRIVKEFRHELILEPLTKEDLV